MTDLWGDTTMVIAKLLLLVVVVVAQQYAITAPNVRPPTNELREQYGSERAVPYFTAFVTTLVWSWAFLEGSVLFALSGYCPPVLARPLLHALHASSTPGTPNTPSTLTPSFLTGALLALIGALLRAHCFHTLGPRFTFELSIRGPSHALVTDGVYSVVRHPSYTGAIAIAMGWLLCVLDPRGCVVGVFRAGWWVQTSTSSTGSGESGEDGSGRTVMVLACVWAVALGMICVVLNERINKEDAMLEKNFGEEWRAWAKRVPCRLVPGVC